jgi:hypothetical protein
MVMIIVALAAMAVTVFFGLLFYFHAKGERQYIKQIVAEAMLQLNSRDAVVASQARANDAYQTEALREQAAEFDKKLKQKPQELGADNGYPTLRGPNGEVYDVLAGMDG